MPLPIAALSFDGDDTLWDFAASFQTAIRHTAAVLTEALDGRPVVTADWLQQVREEVAAEHPGATLGELRRQGFAEAVRRCAPERPELAEVLHEAFVAARASAIRLYPEVCAVLAKLAGRLPLALTTNGNAELSWVGLDTTFTVVTRASECGFQKPDPGIYLVTADRLGAPPEQVLHIGDHPLEDVAAARAAGLQALLLDRSGTAPEAISSLGELLLRV